MSQDGEQDSTGTFDLHGPTLAETPADARGLFMLWQDSDMLMRLMRTSHLTWESFSATPLARANTLQLLGVIGIHARGIGTTCQRRLAEHLAWSRVLALSALADDRHAHTLDEAELHDAWQMASDVIPQLRALIANDTTVVRLRTRWSHLLERSTTDWPQPQEDYLPPDHETQAQAERIRQVVDKVVSDGWPQGFPARRIWLLPQGDGITDVGRVVVAVEHGGTCSGTVAGMLHERLSSTLGHPIDLVPQDQIHPLIWDDVVSHEVLLWKAEDAGSTETLALPAIALAHDHDHEHCGHGPHATAEKDKV